MNDEDRFREDDEQTWAAEHARLKDDEYGPHDEPTRPWCPDGLENLPVRWWNPSGMTRRVVGIFQVVVLSNDTGTVIEPVLRGLCDPLDHDLRELPSGWFAIDLQRPTPHDPF